MVSIDHLLYLESEWYGVSKRNKQTNLVCAKCKCFAGFQLALKTNFSLVL